MIELQGEVFALEMALQNKQGDPSNPLPPSTVGLGGKVEAMAAKMSRLEARLVAAVNEAEQARGRAEAEAARAKEAQMSAADARYL